MQNFQQTAQQVMEGHAYIYQEKDIFIPFWKTDRTSIQLFLKIDTSPDDSINHIANNRHNVLFTNQKINIFQRDLKHLFVNVDLMKYKIEFIINCVALVPWLSFLFLPNPHSIFICQINCNFTRLKAIFMLKTIRISFLWLENNNFLNIMIMYHSAKSAQKTLESKIFHVFQLTRS